MTFQQTIRSINRIRRIIQVLVKYGFEEVVTGTALRRLLPASTRLSWVREDKPVMEYTRWERIRLVCEELGLTFVKLAQVLSNRPDMLPEPLIFELEKLQDRVPPFSSAEAKEIIERELGKSTGEIFNHFEEKPIASASIGQVHRARLTGGEEVVVKVQRPGIKKLVETDIAIIREIIRRGENYFERQGLTNLMDLADTFEKTILNEMNFVQEARNIQQFRTYYRNHDKFYVPKEYKHLSTTRVLVTEYISGCKITDLSSLRTAGLDPVQIAENGMHIYLSQIFEHGYFHADPHPGNILIRKDGVICLLDFGMVGKLMKRDKFAFAGIFVSMARHNPQQMAVNFRRLALTHQISDKRAFENDLNEIIEDFTLLDVRESSMADLAARLQKVIYDYKIRVPGGVFLLLRALTILEGIGKTIHPDMNIYEFVKPYGRKILQDQYSVENIAEEIVFRIGQFDYFFRNFPGELSEILGNLRKGKFHIETEHTGYEPLLEKIDSSTNRLVLAVLIAALLLSSAMIFNGQRPQIPAGASGMPYLSIIGFAAAGMLALILFAIMWKRKGN